jgi:hypothetical protein
VSKRSGRPNTPIDRAITPEEVDYLPPALAVQEIDRAGRNQAHKRRLPMGKAQTSGGWMPDPTPTSTRRERAQESRRRGGTSAGSFRPATGRHEPPPLDDEALEEIEERSRAGLVRSAAAQQLHRSGADRAVPRTPAWLPPRDAA